MRIFKKQLASLFFGLFFLLAGTQRAAWPTPNASKSLVVEKDQAYRDLEKYYDNFTDARITDEIERSKKVKGELLDAGDWIRRNELDDLILQRLESMKKNYSKEELVKIDDDLNTVYAKVVNYKFAEGSTLTLDGIRATQRLWIHYRDAWSKFGLKYPEISPESWLAWATLERADQLKDFLGEENFSSSEFRCKRFQTTEIQFSDLEASKKSFPEIIFWQRLYKIEGKSKHHRVRTDKNGKIFPSEPVAGEGIPQESRYWRVDDSSQDWGNEIFYPNPNWKIRLERAGDDVSGDDCWSISHFAIRGLHQKKYFYFPDWGATGSAHLEFYDSNRNELYCSLINGNSTVRNEPLFLFSLREQKYYFIGEAAGFAVSPDHKWIIWGSGEKYGDLGKQSVVVQSLNFFDIEGRKNYKITSGVSENLFERFEGFDENLKYAGNTARFKRLHPDEEKK